MVYGASPQDCLVGEGKQTDDKCAEQREDRAAKVKQATQHSGQGSNQCDVQDVEQNVQKMHECGDIPPKEFANHYPEHICYWAARCTRLAIDGKNGEQVIAIHPCDI